jgi:hypothetical protein
MYRTLMMVAAADGVLFGLGSIMLTDLVLSVFGASTDEFGRATIRQQGGIILGYGIVAWFLRDLDAGAVRRGAIVGVVVSFALTAILATIVVASGLVNALGWIVVVIHAVVALGLAWVLLRPAAA